MIIRKLNKILANNNYCNDIVATMRPIRPLAECFRIATSIHKLELTNNVQFYRLTISQRLEEKNKKGLFFDFEAGKEKNFE